MNKDKQSLYFFLIILILITINSVYLFNPTIIETKQPFIDHTLRDVHYCSNETELRYHVGMSMYPYLMSEQYYYAEPINFFEVNIGDAIIFLKNNITIHHAVINKYSTYLITKGYNNEVKDNYYVYPEEVMFRDCVLIKQ